MKIALQRYRRLNGESGVNAFAAGPDWIAVQFVNGDVYLYTHASAGADSVEQMKVLAKAGRGLSTYISRYVRDRYAAHLGHDDV